MVWKAGAFEANGARSQKTLDTERIDLPIDDCCAICGRTDDLKDVRYGDGWTIVCYRCLGHNPAPCEFGDLSIPEFLRRVLP
jgi:hypothetical protein